MDDQVILCDEVAGQSLQEVEPSEEGALPGPSRREIALPGVRPVALAEALHDHLHVPIAVHRAPVVEEPAHNLFRGPLCIHANTLPRTDRGPTTADPPNWGLAGRRSWAFWR